MSKGLGHSHCSSRVVGNTARDCLFSHRRKTMKSLPRRMWRLLLKTWLRLISLPDWDKRGWVTMVWTRGWLCRDRDLSTSTCSTLSSTQEESCSEADRNTLEVEVSLDRWQFYMFTCFCTVLKFCPIHSYYWYILPVLIKLYISIYKYYSYLLYISCTKQKLLCTCCLLHSWLNVKLHFIALYLLHVKRQQSSRI